MRLFVSVTALALLAAPAMAQTPDEPSLAFTISGGRTTGAKLWTIDRQELTATGTNRDTVVLGRRLRPGLQASLGVSYYRSPHFGWNAEVAYFGLNNTQRCELAGAAYDPDANNLNSQACPSANGGKKVTSIVAFLVGGTFRLFDETKVQPYIRGNVGLGLMGSSLIETSGIVTSPSCLTTDSRCPLQLASERKRVSATLLASVAAGFAYPLGRGYRVRMEGRDLMVSLPVATGPAPIDPQGYFPPTDRVLKHIPTFTIGFDVLLERRRSRRY